MVPPAFPCCLPSITGDEVIELNAPRLDTATGLVGPPRPLSLRVVTVDEVLTREQELELFFRAADPPAHDKYLVLWQPHSAPDFRCRWLLVRSTGWRGRGDARDEPKALSLIHWNALRGCAEVHTGDHELGAALLDCVRRAAGFHKRRHRPWDTSTESAAQSYKKPSNTMKGPTPETSIRVNRVSGPFGHLEEGASFRAVCAKVRSPAVGSPALPLRRDSARTHS